MKEAFKSLSQKYAPARFYHWMHRGLGLVYLVAFIPMTFELKGLIGSGGLLPAELLIELSREKHGLIGSFFHFPSLFHLWPTNQMLVLLVASGILGGVLLLFKRSAFIGAFLAWISFLSITSIGGDFFIIIIDLFLAEVGFLALFSTYFASRGKKIPALVDFCFTMLNFRLWFCMGVNKFYLPQDVWVNFTFFDTFFQAQPMPTSLAYYLHQTPAFLKHLAEACLFVGEVILPFAVFGNRRWRLIGFATFFSISVLIQLSGNYGYFNVLSVVVALPLLQILKTDSSDSSPVLIPSFIKGALGIQLSLQLIYCIAVFNPQPFSTQNQFNFLFSNVETDSPIGDVVLKPFKLFERWRFCNPYGVFKGIPQYHGEIRFSGSEDGKNWEYYEFKFLPSGKTDALKFFAPYYPRLDHLMFYETLSASNYNFNPLNRIYKRENAWTCRFIQALFQNNESVTRLLRTNPFSKKPPQMITTEVFRLQFDFDTGRKWKEQKMEGFERKYQSGNCSAPLITYEQALSTISDYWANQYSKE